MLITHQEARQLIHFQADNTIRPHERSVLLAHLTVCAACRVYAEEIQEVENRLLPVMKRQWDVRAVPLSIYELKAKRNIKTLPGNIMTMRTALMGFILFALFFSAWQFTQAGQPSAGQSPLIVALPTPSIESTSTITNLDDCDVIRYTVQKDDTLSGIADQFLISETEIVSVNRLKDERVSSGMTLMIPACQFTPTVAVQPTQSTTLTPVIGSVTSSPAPNRY